MVEKIVIIEKYFDNEMNFSSNIIEGIKAVLFFSRKDFTRTKSAKSTKSTKSTKLKQGTFTQIFFIRTKSTKSTKLK